MTKEFKGLTKSDADEAVNMILNDLFENKDDLEEYMKMQREIRKAQDEEFGFQRDLPIGLVQFSKSPDFCIVTRYGTLQSKDYKEKLFFEDSSTLQLKKVVIDLMEFLKGYSDLTQCKNIHLIKSSIENTYEMIWKTSHSEYEKENQV